MEQKRLYRCKNVEMILAAQTIAESFKSNITELAEVRTDWTPEYANGFGTRIEQAMETFLGIDPKKGLRAATSALTELQTQAKRDVSFLKTQIEDDFKKDQAKREEMLKSLGFTQHFRAAQTGNQAALTSLLSAFKSNLTAEMRQEIVAKGTNSKLIDRIIEQATAFNQANVLQETQKSTIKGLTKEGSDAFNAIYDEVIGLCKKAAKYYQHEPIKRDQFSFSKVLAKQGASNKNTKAETEQAVAE